MLVKKLPTEILQGIIYYLSRSDITTCQTVCKKWYKAFIPIIYRTVRTTNPTQFKKFFNYTLNHSLYLQKNMFSVGTQIRTLSIENSRIEPFKLGQLPILCPFLQVLSFDGTVLSKVSAAKPLDYYQQLNDKQEFNSIKSHFYAWRDNIRQFEQSRGIHAARILLFATCKNLTHLSVQFNNQNDRTNSKLSFIKSLKNAPLLNSLSMDNIYLDAEEISIIHNKTPKLSSLTLINTVFLPIPRDFWMAYREPILSLRQLEFLNVDFSRDTLSWFQYIRKTYTFVKVLDIKENPVASKEDDESYQRVLLQIAKEFTRLKILRLSPFVLDHLFFEMLDRNGRCLTRLSLGDGANITQLMNELKGLETSNQAKNIVALSLDGLETGLTFVMDTMYACKNITTLDLTMPDTINFDYILKSCAQLTKLTLSNATLTASQFTSRKYFFKLQSMTLIQVALDSEPVFNMIRFQCPEFISLSLMETKNSMNSKKLEIYLPQHKLRNLVMDRIRVSKRCSSRLGVSRFKIGTEEEEMKWYDLDGYECCSTRGSVKNGTLLKMKARKVKVTACGLDELLDYNFDYSPHVVVQCKDIYSIELTGLKVK